MRNNSLSEMPSGHLRLWLYLSAAGVLASCIAVISGHWFAGIRIWAATVLVLFGWVLIAARLSRD